MTKQTVNWAIVCVPIDWTLHSTDTSEHVGATVCCVTYRTRVPVFMLSLTGAKRISKDARFRSVQRREKCTAFSLFYLFCFFCRFVNFRCRRRTTLFASSCSTTHPSYQVHRLNCSINRIPDRPIFQNTIYLFPSVFREK